MVLRDLLYERTDAAQACQHSPARGKSPALLLCCAVAVLRLATGEQALVTATVCCELVFSLSSPVYSALVASHSGTATQAPAGVSAAVWATLGLAKLVARQFVCGADAAAAAAAAAASPRSGSSSAGRAASGTAADGHMLANPLVEQLTALGTATSSISRLFFYAVLLRGSSMRLTQSDQLQQASFTVQVMEAVLRCYARLLAEPSGVAAAAAADWSTTHDMFKCCSSIVLRAVSLVTTLSNVPEVEAQQLLLACMSVMLTCLSTQRGATGAHFTFILSVSAQHFRVKLLPAEVDAKPFAAYLFLIGCCSFASQSSCSCV